MARNNAAVGRRAEHRAMELLEQTGYHCMRSAASKGLWDIIAVSDKMVRLIQVKYGSARASKKEMEAMEAFVAPENTTKELWWYPRGSSRPEIRILDTFIPL